MPSLDLRDLPLRARFLILFVVGLGTAAVALRIPEIGTWSRSDVAACLALAIGSVVTEQFPIRLKFRTEALNFSLTEALWVGALMNSRPGVLTIAVAAGLLASQLIRRRRLFKVGFNVGQFLVALTVAQAVFARLKPGTPLEPRVWLAAALAMAAYAVVNSTLVAAIISLVERRAFLSVLIPPLGVNAAHFAGNTALGLEGAVMWTASPFLLPTFVLPLVLALLAYRMLVRNVREGDQVRDLIVEYASDGIFVSAPNGTILSWNPAMERITGYSADEAVGRMRHELLGNAAAEGAGWQEAGEKSPDASGITAAVPMIRKDGTEAWVQYSSSVITEGRLRASVVVVHDVTADRQAEQLKSDFVATISHELRTPLTPLKGFLSTLLQGTGEDSAEAREEYYKIMLKQTDRLERLITDLLEVSRIESDRPVVANEPMRLRGPIVDQIRTFGERYPARSISLRLTEPEQAVVVTADAEALGLVVSNLLSNAIKYSPPDSPIEVSIDRRQGEALVSVTDHGDGIPPQEQGRIFDRFYQVDNHMTRRAGGTGLGLYISRRLVEAMSGRLWVESVMGRGSVFWFSLPLAQTPSEPSGQVHLPAKIPDLREADHTLVGAY